VGEKAKRKVKKTSIHIPEDLWRRVKAEAALRGMKISELVQQALEYYLKYLNTGEGR